ncbi:MAG: hypothetical protein WAM82_18010 [Thermoanaerobaculia bacterium]
MPKKYPLPSCLSGKVSQEAYERWLRRRAQAHVKRDRKRDNKSAVGQVYRDAIHRAVIESDGRDAYTGTELDWTLISKYANASSKDQKRLYKHSFASLPTVDHIGDGTGAAEFKICSWRTNDAKHDLPLSEFLSVCQAVLEHHGYVVTKRS